MSGISFLIPFYLLHPLLILTTKEFLIPLILSKQLKLSWKDFYLKAKQKYKQQLKEKNTCMYLCLKEESSLTQSLDISLPKH